MSSEQPLNAKRLLHKLGPIEGVMVGVGGSLVNNVCALWRLLSYSLIVGYSDIIYPP